MKKVVGGIMLLLAGVVVGTLIGANFQRADVSKTDGANYSATLYNIFGGVIVEVNAGKAHEFYFLGDGAREICALENVMTFGSWIATPGPESLYSADSEPFADWHPNESYDEGKNAFSFTGLSGTGIVLPGVGWTRNPTQR